MRNELSFNLFIMKVLITGSSGLVGSAATELFCQKGWKVLGIDNNMREHFFGKEASTDTKRKELETFNNFFPISVDIRDKDAIFKTFQYYGPFDLIIHAAAQPAHDYSTDNAIEDFSINGLGTVTMLEAFRQFSPKSTFIHVSTSKVYGDHVNELPLIELEKRFDLPENHPWYNGVDETMRIDNSTHSLFGASKASGDLMAQEYARYFNLHIGIFRPVCITGPAHRGAPLHGYLSYLVKRIAQKKEYTINGYNGKQVRDNIHAADLVNAFWLFYKHKVPSDFFNIGGGRKSNNSMIEAIEQSKKILGLPLWEPTYSEVNRIADHKWCIFSSEKFKKACPEWEIKYTNDMIMKELCDYWHSQFTN